MFCFVGLSKPVADTHVYKMFCMFCFQRGSNKQRYFPKQNKTETYILSNTLYTKSKYINQTKPTQIKRTIYTNISILDAQKHNIEIDP